MLVLCSCGIPSSSRENWSDMAEATTSTEAGKRGAPTRGMSLLPTKNTQSEELEVTYITSWVYNDLPMLSYDISVW